MWRRPPRICTCSVFQRSAMRFLVRLARRGITAASVLLFVASCVIWFISYRSGVSVVLGLAAADGRGDGATRLLKAYVSTGSGLYCIGVGDDWAENPRGQWWRAGWSLRG